MLAPCVVPSPKALGRLLRIVHMLRVGGSPAPRFSAAKEIARRLQTAPVTAGVPLPTIAAALGHSGIATTVIYTTAFGVEARAFLARM